MEYSENDRIEILLLLKKNNYNSSKTAKQTGISRTTLKKWKEKYNDDILNDTITKKKETTKDLSLRDERSLEVINKTREAFLVKENTIHDKITIVRTALLDKLFDFVEAMKVPNKPTPYQTKTVAEIYKTVSSIAEDEPLNPHDKKTNEFLRNIYKDCTFNVQNNSNDGKESQ